MNNKVECVDHGLQDATYVCCHLVESLNTGQRVGFFYVSEPRGDAWCASCEEIRIREGGASGDWNDASEAFANVTLICGVCYDKVRKLNRF